MQNTNMRLLLKMVVALLLTQHCVAPPVTPNKQTEEKHDQTDELINDATAQIQYKEYLREIFSTLEEQPGFRERSQEFTKQDVADGKLADELNRMNSTVRSRMDEIKRAELQRLRQSVTKLNEFDNNIDTDHLKFLEHVDHTNPHSFEYKDLEKLIVKATKDMAVIDEERRRQFAEHEMQKKLADEEIEKRLDEEHRKKWEHDQELANEKSKAHNKPMHHPGSKQQLKEVWDERDHMDPDHFDPREFFDMHDVDSNGHWDQDEVKALFISELDKKYPKGDPRTDPLERYEELERMKEHVFNQTDTNRDMLISYAEFIKQTQTPDFNEDEGWKTLDEEPLFTDEEYQKYNETHVREIQNMIDNGNLPHELLPYGIDGLQEYLPEYGHAPVDHNQQPPLYINPQQQFHGQAQPQQQFHGQAPPQQQFHGQAPPQHQFQGLEPPQNQFQGQPQLQHQYDGHLPPHQQFQGQAPPQHQLQGQPPSQHQLQGQALPQHQFQGQAPPQHQLQGQAPPQHQYQGQAPVQQQFHGQLPPQNMQQQQYQGNQQIPQYQAPQYHQEQAVQHQQHPQQIPAQQQPAASLEQKNPNQSNVEGHAPIQQPNVGSTNNQAQQHSGLNEIPSSQRANVNSAQASVPNVVSV